MRMRTLLVASLLAACAGDDPTWTLDHATTDGVLLGVWGHAPDDVWAVGGQADRSLVLHDDGTGWTPFAVPTRSLLFSVYGFSATNVYAVGEHGLILHFDGSAWTEIPSGTNQTLFGLWGSAEDVWIVGGNITQPGAAVVLRGSAHASFRAVDVPAAMAPSALFKVHGFASDDVMMVGSGNSVLRWNGVAWRQDPIPTTEPLFSAWGRGANDVFAVGGRGQAQLLHFDGQQWSTFDLQVGSGLSGVFTAPGEPTIAVGANALVLEVAQDGSIKQAELPTLDSLPFLHSVWGDGQGTTYAVGGDLSAYPRTMSGSILRRR